MRKRHRRGLRDHIAAEQAELHSGLALRDTIAHRGYATRYLRGATNSPQSTLNLLRVIGIRRVCRQHVVVGGNDADVGATHQLDDRFVVGGTGCQAMSEVAATELTAIHRLGRHGINIPTILLPQHSATSGDILGHAVNVWMHCVSLWCYM